MRKKTIKSIKEIFIFYILPISITISLILISLMTFLKFGTNLTNSIAISCCNNLQQINETLYNQTCVINSLM